MPEVKLTKAEIEPGEADRLREWFDELQQREQEVIESLQHENMFTESAFIHSEGDTSYLYIYMESKEMTKADTAEDEEEHDLDKKHRDVLEETLAGRAKPLEPIGHFTNPALR